MFGDLFGDMQEKQEAIREELSEIKLEAEAGDGAVKVIVTANREVVNISIDQEKLDLEDKEQLEDLLTVAVNRALELAQAKEMEMTQNMIKDMLPPGLGGLGNLFRG